MKHVEFLTFDNRDALSEALADSVADTLQSGAKENGAASLIVSGGSTPKPFFQALKAKPLAWDKVTVSLADERFVDVSSDDSTEKLVREFLLHDDANYVSMAPISADETLDEGCVRAEAAFQKFPMFDTVILGMGEDGHTASLFPHHPALVEGLKLDSQRLCLPITDSPKPPPERITLTAAAITNCRQLILHITGDSKRDVYDNVLTVADAQQHPIYAFIEQTRIPLTVYWAA